MKKKQDALVIILKIIAAGAISVCLLSAISLLYYNCGIHISNPNGATDYTWRPYELRTNMKEGIAFFRMDKNGYNNADADRPIDILLLGSSHAEAVFIPQNKNIAARLNELLPLFTYNIGISGHDIYRCVDNYSNAIKEYSPSRYTIIETSTIDLDVGQMKSVIDGTAQKIESYDQGIIYYLQLIPAFKPIYKQLEIAKGIIDGKFNKRLNNPATEFKSINNNIENPVESEENVKTQEYNDKVESVDADYSNTLDCFLKKVAIPAEKNSIIPIIVYCPEQSLCSDGSLRYATDKNSIQVFAQTCMNNDIVFIDMTGCFDNLYYHDNHMAHGFINTKIDAGHLNEFGQNSVAYTIAEVIEEIE